jgi:hypothetical protein
MKTLRLILVATLLAALPACGFLKNHCAAHKTRVTHVVIVWLKHHGDHAEREKLIAVAKSLRKIPGVTMVCTGTVLPSARPGVDASFDVAVVMGFESEKALADYESDPKHQQAVKDVLQPLADKFVVYDMAIR